MKYLLFAIAIWTGHQKQITLPNNQIGWECGYELYGNVFYIQSSSLCKTTIEI